MLDRAQKCCTAFGASTAVVVTALLQHCKAMLSHLLNGRFEAVAVLHTDRFITSNACVYTYIFSVGRKPQCEIVGFKEIKANKKHVCIPADTWNLLTIKHNLIAAAMEHVTHPNGKRWVAYTNLEQVSFSTLIEEQGVR